MKLERYFKQFIGGVLRRFTKRLQFLYTMRDVFIESWYKSDRRIIQIERGERDGYVRRWREKPREKRREGKTNSRSSLHLTIYNKSIGAGSRCVPA